MAQKVDGYSDFMHSFQEGPRPEAVYCDFFPATLVVHDSDRHERVFTESEVRALVHEIASTASLFQLTRSDVYRLGERHGISPDPA